ncbi:MAG: YqgE/AlgH family protein [Defluviicoccus sp.]|nr:YqgE/AlgH family protein [Defluviicoccus sp.]MDG4608093.1 YqgE/AlgH family protein [Defluviicoccus sp.]HOT81901.1 YqgE/AlgH family protein [Candidatus Defluviicoccus seviourii]
MPRPLPTETSLVGQLLVAMPGMSDPRFARTVIYMCAHSAEGAMGLVVNRAFEQISLAELLQQLEIDATAVDDKIAVNFGGPVETGRGFVLHSPDYMREGTLVVTEGVSLTATIDILKAIASGSGPRRHLLALGYAGWGPGQLDSEILANGWLHVDADEELVFGPALDQKWDRAMAKLGINPMLLSDAAGHA